MYWCEREGQQYSKIIKMLLLQKEYKKDYDFEMSNVLTKQ
jgi:hypothetical protein